MPFENLDIHRGVPIVLDQARILDKVVTARRGGFCYELNTAFAWLLRALGYQVTVLSAEVASPDGGYGIPFDHMLLRVDIADSAYLADVGFGDSFRRPLALVSDQVVDEDEARFRLVRQADTWFLERAGPDPEVFEPQYRFTLAPRRLEEFTDGCQYHQTSPDSHFTYKLVCTRATPNGRLTLRADRLITTERGSRTEAPVANADTWRRVLREHFDIALDTLPRM